MEEEKLKQESPDQLRRKSDQPQDKSGGRKDFIGTVVVPILTLVIGIVGKGWYDEAIQDKKSTTALQLEVEKADSDRKLERQKLDADLVKLALQGSDDERRRSLGFMVESGLIADPDIRKGVRGYLESKKPLPQIPSDFVPGPEIMHIEDESSASKLKATAIRTTHEVTVVDQNTKKELALFSVPFGIRALVFAPDGSKLLVGGVNVIFLWDVKTMKITARIFLPWVPDSISFSEDSENVIVHHGQEQKIFDENGTEKEL